MQFVRFTKFWEGLSVEQMGDRAATLGYDGLDLVVRDGYAVTPSNAAQGLPKAVRHLEGLGLTCPLVTADVSLTDATAKGAPRLFAAAADAGVTAIKLGYFVYEPGADFEAVWTRAKRSLSHFESLSQRTGVRSVYHTHNGLCLGSNCAGLRHLLEGFDPQLIQAYVDPGHLAVNGEDVRIGLPMLRDRLAVLAGKDADHAKGLHSAEFAPFVDRFVPVGQGAAQWREAMGILIDWNWQGVVSVHTEYTADQAIIQTVGGRDDSGAIREMRELGEESDLKTLREFARSARER